MSDKSFSTFTDQVTKRLRDGMAEGRWQTTLPGRDKLAEEMGCSAWTVEEAMRRLTKEGVLVSQGPGSRRKIVHSSLTAKPRALKVMILLYEPQDMNEGYVIDLLHRLREAGHDARFADKTMYDLGMDVKRIAKLADNTKADAWIVLSGPRDVLDWFAELETPTFALFGRHNQTSLASTTLHKADAMIELAEILVNNGHQRITLLTREDRRKPTLGYLENVFLERLKELGIPISSYNIPDWGNSPKELRLALESLFKYTPPTALIVDQPFLCVAVLLHLARLKLVVPNDVSLACTDMSEAFEWCDPGITHIAWDSKPVITRVVKWADKISRGKEFNPRNISKVRLVTGGTIGPAPKS